MTILNNDNDPRNTPVNVTTGLELLVNSNTMHASLSRKLVDLKDIKYSVGQASYQDISNRHVIVGYGTVPTLKEFDENDHTIMTVTFGNSAVRGYRSYRQAWSATPSYAPKVVAQISNGTTDAWMSWNGATDIDGWNVYAGATKTTLKLLAYFPNTGFETHVSGKNKQKFLQVGAVRDGKVVRKSAKIAPVQM